MARSPTPQAPATQPIERGNVAERIITDLRNQILRGQLARGARLPTERQLAAAYGVSGATIREAVRGLSTMRLIEVRHGSGATVTADAQQLIAISLASMIQLERVGVPEVLGVLGVLNAYAAELAASHADAADIAAMQEALDAIAGAAAPEDMATGLRQFLNALACASRNPLLVVLCDFLAELQIGFARELAQGSLATWRDTATRLAGERQRLVNAIRKRNVEAARKAARIYHERSLKVISELPDARAARLSDAVLTRLLAAGAERKGHGKT